MLSRSHDDRWRRLKDVGKRRRDPRLEMMRQQLRGSLEVESRHFCVSFSFVAFRIKNFPCDTDMWETPLNTDPYLLHTKFRILLFASSSYGFVSLCAKREGRVRNELREDCQTEKRGNPKEGKDVWGTDFSSMEKNRKGIFTWNIVTCSQLLFCSSSLFPVESLLPYDISLLPSSSLPEHQIVLVTGEDELSIAEVFERLLQIQMLLSILAREADYCLANIAQWREDQNFSRADPRLAPTQHTLHSFTSFKCTVYVMQCSLFPLFFLPFVTTKQQKPSKVLLLLLLLWSTCKSNLSL